MTDELETLKEEYRAIKAPPYLATRVRAGITERPQRRRWIPGLAAAAAAVALAVFGPSFLGQQEQTDQPTTVLPSLSQLAPGKPPVSMSSLGSLKSVGLPPLPPKPARPVPPDSQTRIKDRHEKETRYGYI